MKNIFLYFSWVLLAVGFSLTGIAIFKLSNLQKVVAQQTQIAPALSIRTGWNNLTQVLGISNEQTMVETADSRPIAILDFINRHNPQLLEVEPNFHFELVEIADNYQLDFRLLPAIAMKESGLCKVIPENSFNCLGLGVHSRGTWEFESFTENFDTAARVLKKNYIDQGLVTPEEIMTKYTPSSPNGEWARGVNQFMNEIKYNDRQKGREAEESNVVISENNR